MPLKALGSRDRPATNYALPSSYGLMTDWLIYRMNTIQFLYYYMIDGDFIPVVESPWGGPPPIRFEMAFDGHHMFSRNTYLTAVRIFTNLGLLWSPKLDLLRTLV